MAKAFLLVVVIGTVLLILAATSRSDSPTTSSGPSSQGMPSSEETTVPLGPNPPRHPHLAYDVGPPAAVWQYDDLTSAERAIIDRTAEDPGWQNVHAAYSNAAAQQFERARSAMANFRLGLSDLGEIGVVP